MNTEDMHGMLEMKEKCGDFIKEMHATIFKQHGDNFEKYLERFIQFPGALGVASILFISSDLVKNRTLAITGMLLVITSLLIALNIFREHINNESKLCKIIIDAQKPMVDFSRSLTAYSRETTQENERKLENAKFELNKSYDSTNAQIDDVAELRHKFDKPYKQMNLSFWILVFGVILSVLSLFLGGQDFDAQPKPTSSSVRKPFVNISDAQEISGPGIFINPATSTQSSQSVQ